ncbi:hypothetical protein O0I10_007186 [Lichtheimia ornata]|uniref:Uncharacterized protein n=1 Tax=Lichtheimia ornata TaxID=688661 RepID=A0AAD7V233_9FUNG|nr:uncharacterized protein O0I10_007186 [Lichtheimia ornata]KAJ8657106.1 hypothetical protein O0I10_007186 [Lichtheimia ornata]
MDFNVPYCIPLHRPQLDIDFNEPFAFPCSDIFWPIEPAIVSLPPEPSIHKIKKRKLSNDNEFIVKKQRKRMETRRSSTTTASTTKGHAPSQQTSIPEDMATVTGIEEDLQHLQDEWASIEIVFNSIRNAFPVQSLKNAPEELLDEVDRELSIAYDDLKAQVRHLTRNLQRLETDLAPFRPLKKEAAAFVSPSNPAATTAAVINKASSSPC